jgi:predicted NBD/HSP70 family sugar kinase
VVDVLRRRGHASRADIARETGLSRTTVSSLVTDLQAGGLVIEHEGDHSRDGGKGDRPGAGRPGVLLALDPTAGLVLGVDFGHSHLRIAVADLSSRILAEEGVALDVDHSAEKSLDTAADLARELLAGVGLDLGRVVGIGLGIPGPLDHDTGIVHSTVSLPDWTGRRPAAELGSRLGHEVHMDNDANLGALGELTYGAGVGARDLVYVKVASGVGAGLIFGGRLHRGSTGIAGELGHVMVVPEGEVCMCGNRGCLETVAAAPALLKLLGRSRDEELTTEGMLALAAEGDPGARRVLADAGRAIGRALADLCNCINPERVVVGGELGAAATPLLEGIRESIQRWALPATAEATEVVAGVLGPRAELLGSLAQVISDTTGLSSAMLVAD